MFKRPESSNGSTKSLSVYSGRAAGPNFVIPERLSLENVLQNKTCPPCTEKDFLSFCRFVDFSEENLTFYLWYRSYVSRFDAAVATSAADLALAPEWTSYMQEDAIANAQATAKAKLASRKAEIATNTKEIFAGTDFDGSRQATKGISVPFGGNGAVDPFRTPPVTPSDSLARTSTNTPWESMGRPSTNPSQKTGATGVTYKTLADEAFQANGVLAPFSIQPFRHEISRLTATYLSPSGPHPLNLSSSQHAAVLAALQYTTHPSALAPLIPTIESSLKETHKRFIRHALCNGNEARIVFARGLGIFCIIAAAVAFTLLTLSSVPRGYRALPAIPLLLGTSTLIAGMFGMCVVLHGLHHRHLRPWEIYESDIEESPAGGKSASDTQSLSPNYELKASFDSSASTADEGKVRSLEDYPWVKKYQNRNIVRKIFEKQRWVQEPAIRQMQDRVFFESLGWAALVTCLALALFLPLPHGRFF